MTQINLTDCIHTAKHLAIAAGHAILPFHQDLNNVKTTQKTDNTPVTEADLAAHRVITEGLQAAYPDIPVLSEEATKIPFSVRQYWTSYWLIDPLDGTKEFLKGNGEFTVNIALIQDNKPTIGVVYAPVSEKLYWAGHGLGAFFSQYTSLLKLNTIPANPKALRITTSRSHGNKHLVQFCDSITSYSLLRMGSSLKTCLVAQGLADIYPRFGPTSEWDTAAAHCILNEAGGKIIDVSGRELRYNTQSSLLNPWFIAVGDTSIDWLAMIPQALIKLSREKSSG